RQHLAHAAEAWEARREESARALKAAKAAQTHATPSIQGILAALHREEKAAAKNLRRSIAAWRNAYRAACARS
ncbi:MAG TPA: hypothetical protein VIM58_07495, partial [Candidatus Methylacidiphilales bacterium]